VLLPVQTSPITINLQGPQFGKAKIDLLTSGPDVILKLDTEEKRANLATLRHVAQGMLAAIYDAMTYLTGASITVELSSAYDADADSLSAFFLAVPEPFIVSEAQPIAEVIRLAVESPIVRRVLRDFHQAIVVIDDTPFYCYRAIETIAQSMMPKGQENNRKAGWARLRIGLQIEPGCISKLESASQPSRHGKPLPHVTGKTRMKQVKLTRQIVERYILFLLRGEQDLPEEEFPLLTG